MISAPAAVLVPVVETGPVDTGQKADVESREEPNSSPIRVPIASESAVDLQGAAEAQQGCQTARRLIGNDVPPIKPTVPGPRILATPKVICPCCGKVPVLPELRGMTGGRCYPCWIAAKEILIAKSC